MKPLNNYLATHRQRSGLSQRELGHLLGHKSKATVSLLECGWVPGILRTLLMLETLFGVPISDLFAGERHLARETVGKRARQLARELTAEGDMSTSAHRKIDFLQSISN